VTPTIDDAARDERRSTRSSETTWHCSEAPENRNGVKQFI
jgi:hypothetical protein